MAEGEQ